MPRQTEVQTALQLGHKQKLMGVLWAIFNQTMYYK